MVVDSYQRAPPSIRTTDIYLGVMPFVGLQLIGLILVWMFPRLVTWLPEVLLSKP
ncbi:MAG: hypothetical protein O3A06_12415 [Proteobacteria bacterium]|nr:hypothetical protein [Pseudomonadota bacterium]